MSEYRVEVKIRNNLILDRIEECGFKTVGEFCANHKVSTALIYGLVNMKEPIFRKTGDPTTGVQQLCDIFCCSIEDIFTPQQICTQLNTNKKTYKLQEAELNYFIENNQEIKSLEEMVDDDLKNNHIHEAIDKLTPIEKRVIKMRFGIGEDPKTLKECGDIAGVCGQRIRDIEGKALRKLRNHRIADSLISYRDEN